MKTDKITIWHVIIFMILGAALSWGLTRKETPNPRIKNGMDIISSGDSTYYISFKIDSVEEGEPEEEPERGY